MTVYYAEPYSVIIFLYIHCCLSISSLLLWYFKVMCRVWLYIMHVTYKKLYHFPILNGYIKTLFPYVWKECIKGFFISLHKYKYMQNCNTELNPFNQFNSFVYKNHKTYPAFESKWRCSCFVDIIHNSSCE